jgi:hypothetical protein
VLKDHIVLGTVEMPNIAVWVHRGGGRCRSAGRRSGVARPTRVGTTVEGTPMGLAVQVLHEVTALRHRACGAHAARGVQLSRQTNTS